MAPELWLKDAQDYDAIRHTEAAAAEESEANNLAVRVVHADGLCPPMRMSALMTVHLLWSSHRLVSTIASASSSLLKQRHMGPFTTIATTRADTRAAIS